MDAGNLGREVMVQDWVDVLQTSVDDVARGVHATNAAHEESWREAHDQLTQSKEGVDFRHDG